MASRTEQYRRLAQECRQLANMVSAEQARRTVLDMADEWERLADQYEHATDLRQQQEQAQQQQQIQPKDDDKGE